ncbi:MAG: ribonuclease E activity regulator RraA, partial [Myxococcaceae bacterium]
ALAQKNGWAGVIVHGCVRDSEALARLSLGIKALGTHPRKSEKQNRGERDVTVAFLGVTFRAGDWIYVDEDGVLVSGTELKLT